MSEKKGGISFAVYGISVLVALAIGAAGAGYVWFDAQQQLSAAQAAHQADMDSAAEAAKAIELELKKAATKASILGARVEVARAHESLGAMNYGLVGNHLVKASQHLDGVDGGAPIVGRLTSTSVDPTQPEAALSQVLSFAGELDTLLGQ